MHLSALFIRRPVATTLLSLALLLAGSVAYSILPVASLPDVDFPVIGVSAGLPGGSPETMASAVATPLERQFGRIAGVNQMTSSSSLGSASVTLQFDLNRNIDAAARDVQAAINAARSQLPSYLPQNPGYRKANPAEAPILILTLTSDVIPKPQIYDMADSILAQTNRADSGRRPGLRRRQRPARRARRAQPHAARQQRRRPRSCAHRALRRQRQSPQGQL